MAANDSSNDFDEATMVMLSANLPSNAFSTSTPDPRLEKAWQDAERTNQITPVLKEELRLRILARRLQQGEPEIEITPKEPKKYELTEEEKQKRERRKAQNRRAAKKCREKRKMKNLSDAEKYNLMKEKNQQLKNDLVLLRHNEEILRNYCIEHILQDKCPNAEAKMLQKLEQLISQRGLGHTGFHPEVHLPGKPSVSYASSSSSLDQNHPTYLALSDSAPIRTSASDDLFETEKHAATAQLHDLPVEEISSLLPPNADLTLSDHSMESTSPNLSPTTLFNITSPSSTGIFSTSTGYSYFITPNSSLSSSTGTNSASPNSLFVSNDITCGMSYSEQSSPSATSFLNSKTNDIAQYPSSQGVQFDDAVSKISALSHCDVAPDTLLGSPMVEKVLLGSDKAVWVNEESNNDTLGSNNVILNTVLLGDPTFGVDCFMLSFLGQHDTSPSISSCETETADISAPIYSLTPLSPPSPNVVVTPLSPSPTVEASMDSSSPSHPLGSLSTSSGGLPSCQLGSTHKPVTPARPLVRRTSSTASVPSPYLPQLSSALSPPPSVPSPPSHGIPESPSILSGYFMCDENTYHPQFSPISTVV